MTNRLRVIELMGKFHQLWSDKVTISVESYEKMSTEHLSELRELSQLRLLGNGRVIGAEFNTPAAGAGDDHPLLPDCFGPVSMDMEPQDVVGADCNDQTISDDATVSRGTIDCNDSIDNDLQSDASGSASAS